MKCLSTGVSSDEEGTTIEFFLRDARFFIYLDKNDDKESGWGFTRPTTRFGETGPIETVHDGIKQYLDPYQYE